MTKEKQIELLKKLMAFAMDRGNKMDNVPLEIMREVTSDVNAIINPLLQPLTPFYITAFEHIAEHLRVQFPTEAGLADDLKENFNCTAIVFKSQKKIIRDIAKPRSGTGIPPG